MQRTLNNAVINKVGEKVTIAGWLHRLRDLNKFAFAILRDKSGLIQAVLNAEQIAQIKDLQLESDRNRSKKTEQRSECK